MFENFTQELKFKADFTQKWASVDMNGGWTPNPLGSNTDAVLAEK